MRRATSPASLARRGLVLAILALGLVLERWPSTRTRLPRTPHALAASGDTRVGFDGAVRVREDEAILGPGAVELLVRSLHAPGAGGPARTLRARSAARAC